MRRGRPVQRTATCLSAPVAITDARQPNRGCDRFDCAAMKSVDPRESDSRSSGAHTGLSDPSAQDSERKRLGCAPPTRARARAEMNPVCRTDAGRCRSIARSGHTLMGAPFAAP